MSWQPAIGSWQKFEVQSQIPCPNELVQAKKQIQNLIASFLTMTKSKTWNSPMNVKDLTNTASLNHCITDSKEIIAIVRKSGYWL
jgi:hypothetical protein